MKIELAVDDLRLVQNILKKEYEKLTSEMVRLNKLTFDEIDYVVLLKYIYLEIERGIFMELKKMTAKNLSRWIRELENWLKTEENEHNINLYTKWLVEAKFEQKRRQDNIKKWLRWNYDKKN